MFSISKEIIGIDIGFESIKIVATRHTGLKRQVLGMIDIPIDEPVIESDKIKDKSKIAELIKKGLTVAKPHAIRGKQAVTVMPEFLVFSKTIQLPKMEEAELKAAARNQSQQYIPVSLDDVNLDSQVLITHPDEPLVDVLVVATPKVLVSEYLETFRLAGLEILAIETKSIATTRSVIGPADNGGVLILEIGSSNSRISLVDNKQIRFVSTVNIGGDQLIRPLVSGELSREDFKKAKYEVGIPKDISGAAVPLAKLAEDITQAIRYHQNRDYKASRIEQIRLCGHGSLIPGLKEALENEIKIKTVLATFNVDNLPKELDQRYAVSLGLSMYEGDGGD